MRVLSLLCVGALGAAGCGSVKLPEVGATHPASPTAAEAPVPRPSSVLDVEGGKMAATLPGPNPAERPPAHHGQAAEAPPAAPEKLYTCPMHPEVVSKAPGKCPKCGMALVPKKPAEEKK